MFWAELILEHFLKHPAKLGKSLYFGGYMSYCLNPHCPDPAHQKNPHPEAAKFCTNCGTKLRLGDRYRAIKSLGEGYYGQTFLGIDEHNPSKPRCIIKQTPIGSHSHKSNDSESAMALLQEEAMRLEELGRHPQIPSLWNYFVDQKYYYLIQSYSDGLTLEQLAQTYGAFNEEQIRQVLNDSLPVLQFIHAQQIIHRNIKPDNLIYTQSIQDLRSGHLNSASHSRVEGQARLCLVDFETAKFARVSNLFMAGTQIGSKEYAPPEQLRGRATFSSDLYSLGATCLYLLTLKRPIHLYDLDTGGWKWRVAPKHPVSSELGQILDKLVSRLLRDRYTSANEVLGELNGDRANVGDRPTFIPFISTPPPSSIAPSMDRASPDAPSPSTVSSVRSGTPGASSTWICSQTLTQHDAWVRSIALSADGQLLASGSGDKTVRLWSTKTGESLHSLSGHDTWIRAVALSPDGKIVASGSNDNSIRLWDVYTGSPIAALQGHHDWVRAVMFNRNGKALISAGQDKTIRIWNLSKGVQCQFLEGHHHWVVSLALSPNDQFLVSGSRDCTVRLWNLATGQCERVFDKHTADVLDVAITPDGTQMVSSSADQTVKIWDLKTGTLLHSFQGHDHVVNAVAISPDGTLLVTGSNDKTIKLWDLRTYTLLETLKGHAGWVWTVAIARQSSNTPVIASGSWDGVIKLWQPKS